MRRRVLLLGCGGWGAIHLRALTESRRWTLIAVSDVSRGALREAKRHLSSVHCFEDPIRAISEVDCDLISVTIPNPHRVPILLHALRRGVPLLVEKPLVHSRRDLGRILRAARTSRAPIMVSQNCRFEPQTRRMAELVGCRRHWGRLRSGHVDFRRCIRHLGPHWVRRLSGGVGLLFEISIHHFDLMRLVLGANPVRVRAVARRVPRSAMAGWGTIDACLEFPGSTSLTYHADCDVASDRTPWGGRWDLDFERGSLTWQPYAEGEAALSLHTPWRGRWALDVQSKSPDDLFRHHLVDGVYAALARAMNAGREAECGLRDNVQSLAIALAVERAAKTGRTIEFAPFLEEVMRPCP
jgi:predicted dehydrogenase